MTEARIADAGERKGFDVFGFVARFAPTLFLIALMALFAVDRAALPVLDQSLQRDAAGVDHRPARGRHDLRHPDRRHRPLGRLAPRLRRAGRRRRSPRAAWRTGSPSARAGSGYGWGLAALAAIAVGLAGGYLQGLAITRLKVPPFVVTLGGMSAFRGAALLFAAGGPISGFEPSFTWWGQGKIGPVPIPVIIFLAAAALAHVTLRYTRYGRQVYAVGGNPEAARLSGLNVNRIVASVYVIMGFFAGLGSFVLAARLNSAEAVAGTGYELTVIASVVIGGTSLFGGSGTIFGTVVGTILIGVLLNGLVLMNVSSYIQQIVIGVIIVLAVAFDTFAKSRRRKI